MVFQRDSPSPPAFEDWPRWLFRRATPGPRFRFWRVCSILFRMIKAVIFDLDSCLAAANEVGEALFADAFAAIRSANKGHLAAEQLEAALNDCWRFPFD